MSLRHYLQLTLTPGLGPTLIQRLIASIGTVEQACQASVAQLQAVEGIGSARAGRMAGAIRAARDRVDAELDRAARADATVIAISDPAYPPLLKWIPDPSPILYCRGALEPRDLHAVALVGSRRASQYGREQAGRLAALLGGAGVTVISGGARGIDSAAHRGALSHPMGRTIAVLGSGVDVAYPPENEALFRQISQRGVVMSELPMGTPPNRENFPKRNRLISGLSRGVLVIEADTRSGALITARQAAEDHNRPVMALPGRIDNPLSAGPHQLIRDGATLVTNLEEIFQSLSPLPDALAQSVMGGEIPVDHAVPVRDEPVDAPTAVAVVLSERQRLILDQFDGQSRTPDQLVDGTGLSVGVVLQELTFLNLKGLLRRTGGQTYEKISHRS